MPRRMLNLSLRDLGVWHPFSPRAGRLYLTSLRADMGVMKWVLREITETPAREGPAVAGASIAARFFAGCGRLPAEPVIGAWSPPSAEATAVELPRHPAGAR
jgi:hypothetical protein